MKKRKFFKNCSKKKEQRETFIIKEPKSGMKITIREYPSNTPEDCTRTCMDVCPYSKTCSIIKNPKYPEDKSSFMDYCCEGFGMGEGFENYYPILIDLD